MDTTIEVWKPIPGFNGLYEASTFGRIRSVGGIRTYEAWGKTICRSHAGRVLKPQLDGKKNYLHVCITDGKKSKSHQVHRLVAQTFIENPFNLPEINHIDEDKTNNAVWNLEWCDHKYNNTYGSKMLSAQGERNAASKLTANTIRAIRSEYIPHDPEHGITGLAKKYGISATHLFRIVNRKRWGWLD